MTGIATPIRDPVGRAAVGGAQRDQIRLGTDVGGAVSEQTRQQLEEQVAYYRARANVYDAWADRAGHYDRGHRNAGWHAERLRLAAALAEFCPSGDVLEIAGGTGQWTAELVRHADSLTVLDAAPEALERNVARLGETAARVRHVHADFFHWEPSATYDVVCFAYWLSHVPPEHFGEFWDRVAACLKPGGRVFVIDNMASNRAAELDPERPGADGVSVLRDGPDGRIYRVWKVLWRPEELCATLGELGWDVQAFSTGTYFLWAEARRR
jgi:demethylmenaquinone methyltransferase/2-methoxy-6-polyprenyl-1,4-benzoquinol methylase